MTVVNAESATSYMHQPKISLLRTGEESMCSTAVVIQDPRGCAEGFEAQAGAAGSELRRGLLFELLF
jgi:hypothetical protein